MAEKKKRLAVRRKPARPTLAEEPYDLSEGVTQSLLTMWSNCRVKARYYLKGWRSRALSEPLAHGSFMHSLLERMHRGVRVGTITQASAPELFWPFADEWIKDCQKWATAPDLQRAELVVAKAAAVYEPYCQHWATDFEPTEWLEVEGKFDVNFQGHRLRGMADGVRIVKPRRARKNSPWDLWLLESKNRGQVKATADDTLRISFQNQFYLTAWRELLDPKLGAKLKGVLQNVIRRPMHKLGKSESLPDYTKRVRAKVEEDPSYWFMRSEVVYPKQQLEAFREELLTRLAMFREWVRGNFFPTYSNERACDSGGVCRMLRACSSYGSDKGYRQDGRLFEELED